MINKSQGSKMGGMKTMKKYIAIIVALILILTIVGCAKEDTAPAEQETTTEESLDSAEATEEADETDDSSDSGIISPEFKETMDNYEAWFDHYCDVMKRYQEDSSDLELLSEMTDLLAEETTMLEEMENMDQDDMNAAELAYYLEVTARIEKNLLEVAY